MPDEALHSDSLHCPDCDYDLFGIDSDHCPECGLAIDREILGESRLPWTHRQHIGRIRAFWRTLILATFRPRKIAREVNRPVSYADAQKFRHLCLLLAWLPLLGDVLAFAWVIDVSMFWWERMALILICGFSAWLYLLCITGLPSLFFHPRTLATNRQNRAVALSYYGAGPLVFLLLPAIALAIAVVLMAGSNRWFFQGEAIIVLGFSLLGLVLTMQASSSFVLLKHATACSALRRWTMDVCLVTSWIVLAWVVLLGIPAITIYAAVMVQSLL
jgi:hypothetical protein